MMNSKMKHFTGPTLVVATALLASSCKMSSQPKGSNVENLGCIGTWLAGFIDAIPLPGFSLIGHSLGRGAAKATAGSLKSSGKESASGLCGNAAAFSDQQLQQMKKAIAEGFDEQNHKDALALENDIETKLAEFVPDQDRFTQYTMNKLDDMINAVNKWWSNYDQSTGRVYHINDFVIVTGYGLKAYQHQVREVALEAASTKSPGDAIKVRGYARNLSDKADHARKEFDEMSTVDVAAVAKSFWKDGGSKVAKSYSPRGMTFVFCAMSNQGKAFNTDLPDDSEVNEIGSARLPRFLEGMRATKTFADLSVYVQKNGSFCCSGGTSCNSAADKVEPAIATAIDETTKHLKEVMFTNNPDLMMYYNDTLPTIIAAAGMIRDADDATVFSLAAGSASTGQQDPASPVTAPSPTPASDASGAGKTCPDGDNGPGKGYGDTFQCGDKKCAKTDKTYATQCVIGG